MSRRSQSSDNEVTSDFEDYIDPFFATTGVPGQGVLHPEPYPRAGADTPSSETRGLNVLPSLSTTGIFFDICNNNSEVNGGQFTNVVGSMTQYSGNAAYSVIPRAHARGDARHRYATTGPHYAQPNGNPSYGYSQFPAPPNPQFQGPPSPQFQGPPNPQFYVPQNRQFQGLPPNNVHPYQAPNFGRSFSGSPAYALNSQNSGPRLPDPRAVNPEGDLAAQIDARRAARAANPPFRNPPPLQSSFSTPEARRDFARTTRAPTWSSAQPPSLAMPTPIPNSSRRRSQYSDNSMPLSSSPEQADRASRAPPSSTPVASTSQQPQVPPSARAHQKSRKTEVDESDSSDSEGTAKPLSGKNSSAIEYCTDMELLCSLL
ncbi:hypothetical protein B0H13DRAFT_2272942 [Mycena leptocephala]|nr:hypothetical protein B0H13DRAFT_2272942 [Mycena leptocephala]